MTVDPARLPTVVLARRPLPETNAWPPATSWFGGRPALGDAKWPRGPGNRPLEFLAQIDLAELARAAGPTGLPETGALAVFVGMEKERGTGRVLHVPSGCGLTEIPPDMPPMAPEGEDEPDDPAAPARRSYPFWPMELLGLGVLPARDWEGAAMKAALKPLRGWRERGPFSREALAASPVYWHAVRLLLGGFRRTRAGLPERSRQAALRREAAAARVAVAEADARESRPLLARLLGRPATGPAADRVAAERRALAAADRMVAQIEAGAAGIDGFVADLESFLADADPWTPMGQDDVARFRAMLDRARAEFRMVRPVGVSASLVDLTARTLREMASGEPRAMAALPPEIRAEIDATGLLPDAPPFLHLMFGEPVDIQGAAEMHEGDVLLFQFVYDVLLDWRFGDVGAYQFWIAPEALAAGDLSRVAVTFEGH